VTRLRLARTLWIGAAAILVAAALVALVAVLRGDFSDTDARILGTLAAVLFAGSTAIAGLALVERGGRLLGWAVVGIAGPAFAALVYSIWDVVFDGAADSWRWGWLGALVLLAALLADTARLIARTRAMERLAEVAGGLAGAAAGMSAIAVWSDDPGDALGRVVAVLWILAALAYLLVPVLQRFTAADEAASARQLGELDGVELLAVRGAVDGVPVESPLRGERLVLRRCP
jgi:hypothetical protein